jgi:hypothetical protein
MNETQSEAETVAIPRDDGLTLLFALDVLSAATAICFTTLLLLDLLSYLK